MREILRSIFDRQLLLTAAFILAIGIAKLALLNAGVDLPDVPRLVQVVVEAAVSYALAALVWWVWDRVKQRREV